MAQKLLIGWLMNKEMYNRLMSGEITEVFYLDLLYLINNLNLYHINTLSVQQSAGQDIYYCKVDEHTIKAFERNQI